jgi:hypothetical protein
MSVQAELVDDRIVLSALPMYKDRCYEVPGARSIRGGHTYQYPLSWAHCVMLRGVFGEELEVGPALARWATEELARRVTPALAIREEIT